MGVQKRITGFHESNLINKIHRRDISCNTQQQMLTVGPRGFPLDHLVVLGSSGAGVVLGAGRWLEPARRPPR